MSRGQCFGELFDDAENKDACAWGVEVGRKCGEGGGIMSSKTASKYKLTHQLVKTAAAR